jgi:hypothetical protein
VTTSLATLARRTAVVLAAAATLVASSGPAQADVPEGWSDPDPVNKLHALALLGGGPLLLFLVITALVLVPGLMRGERLGGTPSIENQWIGGPRRTTAELAAPDNDDSQAGGASARW